jgi:SAM-dependent methyltransferase
MENINKDFLDSLDLPDSEMEKHIPYVLQDLWGLGSIPEYIYQLIKDNVDSKRIEKIIDLGCGKGAVLIYLAKRLKFQGLGIDIVSDFIESAKIHSIENSVNNRLDFVASDFLEYIDQDRKYDIVIYGYDSGILGDVLETITRLQNCISDPGYLILEIAFTPENKEQIEDLPTEKELVKKVDKSDLKIIDKILWPTDKIKAINIENNIFINKRIDELKKTYPEKTNVFEQYISNQKDECKLIENELICSTLILKK